MNKTTVNIGNVNFNLNMVDKGGFIKVKTLRALSIVMIIIAIFSMTVTVSFANSDDQAATLEVVNRDTEWRYLDDNTDPAEGFSSITAWTTPRFVDSSHSPRSQRTFR